MSLPKIISQDTYDEVVLENIVDFNKTISEAIDDATKEFEAQGVLLTNIIKNVTLGPDKDKIVHPIVVLVEQIREITGDESTLGDAADKRLSPEKLVPLLAGFTEQCKISLAHRVMASKHGAYSLLIRLVNKTKQSGELLVAVLAGLVALTDGNPDLLESDGVALFQQLMQQWKCDHSSPVMELLARWCYMCTLKHEGNRQTLCTVKVPHMLVSSLSGCTASRHKQRLLATLRAIRSFTLDDDIRAEFGKAHDNCRGLVEEENIIPVAISITKDAISIDSSSLTGEVLAVLSSVCVRAEYCLSAVEAGALKVLGNILLNFIDSSVMVKQSATLLATLAGDDIVKVRAMESNMPLLITRAMGKHQMHAGVCAACCSAVSMLALRHPQHATSLIECGAAAAVLQAMKQHSQEKQVQKLGCLAVRNLCSRSPSNAARLREMQAECAVQAAVAAHGSAVNDLAKSALRDLGVTVALEEKWQGKGHQLQQGV